MMKGLNEKVNQVRLGWVEEERKQIEARVAEGQRGRGIDLTASPRTNHDFSSKDWQEM